MLKRLPFEGEQQRQLDEEFKGLSLDAWEAIHICLEDAYRRGFQQGYTAAKSITPPTNDQVRIWRFHKPMNLFIPAGMSKHEFDSVLNAKLATFWPLRTYSNPSPAHYDVTKRDSDIKFFGYSKSKGRELGWFGSKI